MARVVWSAGAARDLASICEYIARDSAEYASVTARRIVAVADALPDHPLSGRAVREARDPSYREKIVGNYRVIYRVTRETVEIVTVIHGARLLGEGFPPAPKNNED